ncbi:MAG: hypothetical protein KBA30_01720 [Clostridia bacterium]|nr:hypothetical protein [Clostridia bacterium]
MNRVNRTRSPEQPPELKALFGVDITLFYTPLLTRTEIESAVCGTVRETDLLDQIDLPAVRKLRNRGNYENGVCYSVIHHLVDGKKPLPKSWI